MVGWKGAVVACCITLAVVLGQEDVARASRLDIAILPFGVEATNESARVYWQAQSQIPSTRVAISVRVHVGNEFEQIIATQEFSLDTDLQIRMVVTQWPGGAVLADFEQPLSSGYDVNIGSMGSFSLTSTLSFGPHMIATHSHAFQIAPLLMDTSAAPDAPLPVLFGSSSDGAPGAVAAMPAHLSSEFLMGGKAKLYQAYYDASSLMGAQQTYPHYSHAQIEDFIARARNRDTRYYGWTDTFLFAALDAFPIQGQRVLLVGSNVPWYEAVCLAFGAALCITLEYNELRYEHAGTHTFQALEWQKARNESVPCAWPDQPFNCQFDAVFSISSFEHDGLGRYGDPVSPNGDLDAMRSLRRQVAPNGHLFLSVPVGEDAVYWNEGRVYGALRLPLLFEGYHSKAAYGVDLKALDAASIAAAQQRHARIAPLEAFQPVFVLSPNVDR